MKVIQIISDAYRFAQIVAEEGQDLTDTQVADGLNLLNNYVINKININGDELALNDQTEITLPIGTTEYLLDGYIAIYKAQYNLGNVWVDSQILTVDDYYNEARIVNSSSIPYILYTKRTADGLTLKYFFQTDRAYQLRIVHGIKNLSNVLVDDEVVSEIKFYMPLVMWMLAQQLLIRNQMPANPFVEKEIQDIKSRLNSIQYRNTSVRVPLYGRDGCSAGSPAREAMKYSVYSVLGGYRP